MNKSGQGDRLPILSLDFDGVVHDYKQGWKGGAIYGQVTDGFFDWAVLAAEEFTLVIHSSRAQTPEGAAAILEWLAAEATRTGNAGVEGLFSVQAQKPPALVTIDDRCVRFDGNWNDPKLNPPTLRAFKPWMQKEPVA
jgi:hypothetical protein